MTVIIWKEPMHMYLLRLKIINECKYKYGKFKPLKIIWTLKTFWIPLKKLFESLYYIWLKHAIHHFEYISIGSADTKKAYQSYTDYLGRYTRYIVPTYICRYLLTFIVEKIPTIYYIWAVVFKMNIFKYSIHRSS